MTNIAPLLILLSIYIGTDGLTQNQSSNGNILSRFKFHQTEWTVNQERNEISFFNSSLVSFANATLDHYNRTTRTLFFNIVYLHDHTSLMMTVQNYKFISNEYRYFPLAFEMDLCTALKEDTFDFGALCKCGNLCTNCNYKKNTVYYYNNWLPDVSKFPPHIPYGRYKLDVSVITVRGAAITLSAYTEVIRRGGF